MPWNPTTRIPNSSSSSQKASHGNISGIIFKRIWKFQISLQLFLNFSVIFLDFSNALSNDCTTAWVTWPERPKGMKDVIEQARRAQSHKSGPGGPLDFWYINIASNMWRLRNKTKNYVGQLQKSIVDNVTNIYGILFIATISLISGAFGLYHAWRLRANLEKEKLEKLEPALLPLDAFLVFAVLSSGALLPYFSHALRCGMFYLFLNPRHFL